MAAHAHASRVEVTVRRRDDRAVLEVADDGRGIEPRRGRAAPSGEHVGLEILRELVRDAGGELELRPREGGGTVLHVEVPA